MPEDSSPVATSPTPPVRWMDGWNTALGIFVTFCALSTGAWTTFVWFQDEITSPLAGYTFKHVDQPDASCNAAGRTIIQYEVANPGPGNLDVSALQIHLVESVPSDGAPFPNGLVYKSVRGCSCRHWKNGDGTVIEATPVVGGQRRVLAKGNSFAVKISVPSGTWDAESVNVVLSDGREVVASDVMPDYPGLASTWRTRLILPTSLLMSALFGLSVIVLSSLFAKWSCQRHERKIRENERMIVQREMPRTLPTEGDQDKDILKEIGAASDPNRPDGAG